MNESIVHIEKKKALVPELRFCDFKEEWVKFPFGKAVKLGNDKYNPETSQDNAICIELESISKESSILLETFEAKDQKSIKNSFSSGDVLFGKLRPNLRKFILAPFDGVCSSEIWVLRGVKAKNEFVFRILQTEKFYRASIVTSGSKMPRADWEYISSSPFYFPSIPEQQKIASFLSALDQKIQLLTRKKELLEQYKKGVMQQLFSQQIRFKDEDGKEFTEWEEKRIGQIFKERSKKGFDDKELLSVTMSGGVIKRSDIEGKDNSSSDKTKYKYVLPGDIVYNSMRMWQGASGVSEFEGIVSPAYTILAGNDQNVSDYFGYYFKMRDVIFIFQRHSQGLTSDTWNLKYPAISKIKMQVPSKAEQQKIVNFLKRLDDKITETEAQLTQTQTFKKGLLQKMFV